MSSKAMAAVATGASPVGWLVSPIVSKLLEHNFLKNWEKSEELQKGDKMAIQCLRLFLLQIQSIIQDAEKQLENSGVRDWVEDLKDVLHDAEDVLDMHEAELLVKQLSKEDKVPFSFSRLGSGSSLSVADQINDIWKRLDEFCIRGACLGLTYKVHSAPPVIDSILSRKIGTSSLLGGEESTFVGRDHVKEEMIRQLLAALHPSDDQERILVLPIVGMGGLGKTTLAQLLFKDTRVVDFYQSRAWVYVGQSYSLDLERTTTNIIESVWALQGNTDACNFKALDALQRTLVYEIREPFLLVLDDALVKVRFVWERLLAPLKDSQKRCRVIVTTRDQKVADAFPHTSQFWRLEPLDNNSMWNIFAKAAAFDTTDDASKRLEPIGRQIVQTFEGLPFAAKAIGGILRRNRDAAYWKSIISRSEQMLVNNEYKDFMLSAFMLSYNSLPNTVKLFFSCFSLFPRDYQFEYEYLGQRDDRWVHCSDTWMIQRLSLIRTEIDLRYSTSDCVNELLDRSFLQYVRNGSNIAISMHDSTYDVAERVSKEEFGRVEDDTANKFNPKKIRHISFFQTKFDPNSANLKEILNYELLRTLLYNNWGEKVNDSHKILHGWFERLRYLRVLSLYNLYITSLPDSIENLKLLRYLDLCLPKMKELPSTISHLYKLQGLNLHGCVGLRELPESVTRLVNLIHLDVETELLQTIDGIGQFTNLQELKDYHVEERERHGISQLEKMNRLCGSLSIRNLEIVTDKGNAEQAQLGEKTKLVRLELSWNDLLPHADIVEGLRPHTGLEELSIGGCREPRLPDWLTGLSRLVRLDVSDCPKLEDIPSLPRMLQSLSLSRNRRLKSMFSSSLPPTYLQRLRVFRCNELDQSLNVLLKASSSSLRYLDITGYNWPLEGLSCVTALLELELCRCEEVVLNFAALTSLTKMSIEYCRNVVLQGSSSGSELHSSLSFLHIKGSPVLELLHRYRVPLSSLINLEICSSECDDLTLSECLKNATALERLCLESCVNIRKLPSTLMHSLAATKQLYISDCQELEELAFPPTANISITISNCPKFFLSSPILNPSIWNLYVDCLSGGQLSSLFSAAAGTPIRSISLTSCSITEDTIASVLGGPHRDATLKVLTICHCPGPLSLNFSSLGSLESLAISNCSTITSLPVLSSLVYLSIEDCCSLDFMPIEASIPFFPKLKVLHATGFSLQQLTDLLKGLTNSPVKSITITRCNELKSFDEDLELALLSFKSSLRNLSIQHCEHLRCLPAHLEVFEALRELVMYDCPQMSELPNGRPPETLQSLQAEGCPKFKELYEQGNKWFSCIPEVSF